MCSDGLKSRVAIAPRKSEELLNEKEAQNLSEFEAHIRRGIDQYEAGLGKTFDDKEKFLDYLKNL